MVGCQLAGNTNNNRFAPPPLQAAPAAWNETHDLGHHHHPLVCFQNSHTNHHSYNYNNASQHGLHLSNTADPFRPQPSPWSSVPSLILDALFNLVFSETKPPPFVSSPPPPLSSAATSFSASLPASPTATDSHTASATAQATMGWLGCNTPALTIAFALGAATCAFIAILSVVLPDWYKSMRDAYRRRKERREQEAAGITTTNNNNNNNNNANSNNIRSGQQPPTATTTAGLVAAATRPELLQAPSQPHTARGSIMLVGAGPGSVNLLTIAAMRAIKEADVVVCDRLVPDAIRRLARGQVVVTTKRHGTADAGQEAIYAACLRALAQGKRVVRLKGGDPFVFGRGAEEVLRFRQHGYEPIVIPGISSCTAAPLLSGVPLTTRGVADRFLVCTAHGQQDSDPRYPMFDPACTFVFLMGVRRVEQLTKRLIAFHKFPPSTPACIVQEASMRTQCQLSTTLELLPCLAKANNISAPATIVIGNAVTTLMSTA
ncbi:uroporphyrin-III C-methyltransferase [Salpingoeca rosetta]|uniref:Uroporphyrin-III C-methyltransferase n=1 Tax=Salpingoeca rosetta (strain ATCC 50818 / BSB-021) TaxID=946362 RepID=F2US58_SALR5|nr:uroporphyrin-III C-methyltransferase [Salpingoeca rosetta]EGD80463.1 uroporphyrin-III C-methyltransferase [Salpingoeca rosetta]|eukprot:XP_004988027.1 uroporphyrin-III C-methyltransferase [Salpingoeca rosetta]